MILTKTCKRCHQEKGLDEFYKRPTRRDGCESYCKPCCKERAKAWEQANPGRHAQQQRKRGSGRKLQIILAKGGQCHICGGSFHPSAYDFHHRERSSKERNLGHLLPNGSPKRIQREVDQCDLLCANCHRLLHAMEYCHVQTLHNGEIMPHVIYDERSHVERLLTYYRKTNQPIPLDLQVRAAALGFILDQE